VTPGSARGRGGFERQSHPTDRRVKLLVLTTEGRRMRDRLDDQLLDRQPGLGRLTVTQYRELLALARRLGLLLEDDRGA
jgi:hypothetical protein